MFATRPAPPRHATGDTTRAALIDAATEVFIEEGFKAARVQDIAQRAAVRLSAINYHFGSKEGLYLAVLQHHAQASLAHAPLLHGDPHAPLRERFDFFVRSLLTRLIDPRTPSRIARLGVRELTSPTAALDVMFVQFSLPQTMLALQLIREILGPRAPEAALHQGAISVVGQCLAYRVGQPVIERLQPGLYDQPDVVARLGRQIADFSWAGLQAMAQAHATTTPPHAVQKNR
ncbi:CerR family C-terminal domain-containing protein [Aquabacterium sp.]|uniref:CerR family C-terminal domain-containing protein n=1 Tax=Aquabacterium sp. TaxID=1872578 RepID=UPI0035B23285